MSDHRRLLPFAFIALLIAVGGAFLGFSLTYRYWAPFGPGPGFLPRWLVGGLLLCTLMLIVEQIRTPLLASFDREGGLRIGAACGLMAATAFLIPRIGMMASLGLFMFLFAALIERNGYLFSVVLSVAAVAAIYAIFGLWLGVQFPEMYF